MKQIKIYCDNIADYFECEPGTELKDIVKQINHKCKYRVLAALVDNKLKELSYTVYFPIKVKFIDITHSDGRRSYMRTLSFILQKSVVDLFPQYSLVIDYSLPNGLYGELREKGRDGDGYPIKVNLSREEVLSISQRMREYIAGNYLITRKRLPNAEAAKLYRDNGRKEKALLVESLGKFFTTVYFLDGYADTFYGPLLYSTGDIDLFDLFPYSYGFCLQSPSSNEPWRVADYKYQDKLSSVFKENSDWCAILGVNAIASVNKTILSGNTKELIQVAEALHERKYSAIADMIYKNKNHIKLVLISGPSSSGKTTTSKRVALQCKVLGLNPVIIAMDNYFVNREFTPKDEKGEYDFEDLHAMDLHFLNEQLNDLFAGKEVELPKFNFVKGERYFDGTKIQMGEKDILIMEGIHALNPELSKEIDQERIFKIYASAVTSLSIDENNTISTSDNRLLRRIVRDNSTRGISPEETILRWASVRRGEEKNIFPFQENSDVMFNSSLIFDLPLLKYYAEPLLLRIPPTSAAYVESIRLQKFLSYIVALTPVEISTIPPTSIVREFIGGSTFDY